MNLSILISVLFLAKLSLSDEESSCDKFQKMVEYGSIVCDIEYEVCTPDGLIQIDACFGYRCRLEINGKCYYYSYQAYDKRRCLSQCCGYTMMNSYYDDTQMILQCLSLNLDKASPVPEGPLNKLPVILGSVLGVIFFIILTACICCRHRIKAIWQPENTEAASRLSRKTIRQSNYQMESNNINFLLQNSDSNIIYDQQIQCTICLNGSNEIQTSCGHWFHLKCLGQWCQKNLKCPNCVSEQFNPIRVFCAQCHKPYVQLKLNRKNRLKMVKKQTGDICKACNELKS